MLCFLKISVSKFCLLDLHSCFLFKVLDTLISSFCVSNHLTTRFLLFLFLFLNLSGVVLRYCMLLLFVEDFNVAFISSEFRGTS